MRGAIWARLRGVRGRRPQGLHGVATLVLATALIAGATDRAAAASTLKCDESLKAAFRPDAHTTVLQVKRIRKGEPYPNPVMNDPHATFGSNLCWVKLLVGPGLPGPADAPSTSRGVGIEVWLPDKAAWNRRVHALGTGGWSTGGPETVLGRMGAGAAVASDENAVTSTMDNGFQMQGGAFALKPDGSHNAEGWRMWAHDALLEQAVKTKALAAAYYGEPAKYAYFSGGSGGGRQALHIAQNLPEQYDGILSMRPGPDWSSFIPEVYPALVALRDLGGDDPKPQLDLASRAAVAACDVVGGQHLGFIIDIKACRYDPTKDLTILCRSEGGTNDTPACLSRRQALAMNKIWYGLTVDGSVPDPAVDNGWDAPPSGKRKWYGYPRGGSIRSLLEANTWLGGPGVGRDVVAIALRDPKLGTPAFKNALGNGEDGWKNLTYEELAGAYETFKALDAEFGFNTNNPDLARLRNSGTKLLHVTSVHDSSVWVQGHTEYYDRVVARMGGRQPVSDYYKFYVMPGLFHGFFNGSANRDANPPVSSQTQLYQALTAWVEKGVSPDGMVFESLPTGATLPAYSGFAPSNGPVMSLPACAYPTIATWVAGDVRRAESYRCR